MVKHKETGEVHVGTKGGTTKCGVNTASNPENWVSASGAIVTCGNCNRDK